jgi:hypothetical protein
MEEPPVWGKQTIEKSPAGAISGLDLLPGFEPGQLASAMQPIKLLAGK